MSSIPTSERDDLGYLLARASQRWDAALRDRCRAHGFPEVRPAFGAVLLPLFAEDGLRMGELADRARLSKQNMTTLVREVEKARLVARRPDPNDRRAQQVWLTARAEQFRPAASQILDEMDALLTTHLSPSAASSLQRSLAKLTSLPSPDATAPGRP